MGVCFMTCKQIKSKIIPFLDHELSPVENLQVEQHLSGCKDCQKELADLRKIRQLTGLALQSMSEETQPSPQVWNRLQQKMAEEADPSRNWFSIWFSRLAPGGIQNHKITLPGENKMLRRSALLLSGALLLGIFGFFLSTKNVTPVSAKQVLEKAYEANKPAVMDKGISHMVVEIFHNNTMEEGKNAGTRMLRETYTDFGTGNLRTVQYALPDKKIMDVFGYDGEYTYSTQHSENGKAADILTVYRSPQSREKVTDLDAGQRTLDAEEMFKQLRSAPDVKLETPKELLDGKKTIILLSTHSLAISESSSTHKNSITFDRVSSKMIFDAGTYKLLEITNTAKKNDKEFVISSTKYITNEVLPAESPVEWDFSDLTGIKLVDDMDRSKGDLLPEKITPQELAAHTKDGFLLKEVPAGFELTLSAPPRQPEESSYYYTASYRNSDQGYLVIQTVEMLPDEMADSIDETLTTGTGLTIQLLKQDGISDSESYMTAFVEKSEKTCVLINSNLPKEEFKKYLEGLENVK